MDKSWYWRLSLVLGLLLLALYAAAPSFLYFTAAPEVRRSRDKLKELIPSYLPASRVSFGIDLQGGLHLVMGVDADKAVQNRTDRVGDEIVEAMQEKGKTLSSVTRPGNEPVLEIVLSAESDWDALREIIEDRRDTFELRSRSGAVVQLAMRGEYETQLRDDAVAQALKTLRNRIDKYGVTEPEVRRRGQSSILIQIAGLTAEDQEVIKGDIIGRTAQLEFKLVDDDSQYFANLGGKLPDGVELSFDGFRGEGDRMVQSPFLFAKDRKLLEQVVAQNPPAADRTVRYQRMDTAEGERWRTYLLHRKTALTGDSLVAAGVIFDPDENQYAVSMQLDRRGADIFDKLTAANIKRRFAIVLDEVVDSAPVIQSRIPNGNARITLGSGARTNQEILADAKSLSVVLNAGALPAPVYPQEERTVGATLGDDAVNKGKTALVFVLALIGLIMLVYYRASGIIALCALSLNMLFLFAALAAFGSTLTLPGLAGLALTVGMAVDANIIQFERIREELGLGKGPRAAVDAGFDKAFSAIFDANVTTLLACIVLYQYGSGPIRGFATTLGVGVVINTFTAVVVPRLLFDYLARGRRVQELSI